MNKLLKVGLWMQGIQLSLMFIIGLALLLVSIPWNATLIGIIVFCFFNLLSIILIIIGLFKND